MRDVLITLMVFGSLPAIFKWPWMGILVFSWISYMNPHRLTYGFAYSFQFALIVAIVTIIAFAIGRDDKKIPTAPITVLLLLFIFWTCITTIAALAPENATTQFIKFVKIQLMTILTLAMINTRYRLNWLIIVIVCSLGFYGVRGGIFSVMTGGNYRVWGPAGSFFEDNNQLALTLIMTLPFMHYLQLISNNRWVRHLLSVVMLLTLAAIIGTYSRGALLALATMGAVLWLRSTKKLPVAIAAAICIVGVMSFMPQKWFDRMDTINEYEEDSSASGRLDAWLFAINVANDRPLGGGFKVNTRDDLWPIYNPDSPTSRAPHSIYFEVLGEHGWTGLAIFLTLFFTAMYTCSRTRKRVRHRPDLQWAGDLSMMMQVSLVGYGAAGAFLNLSTFDLYYHVLAIIVMTRYVVGRELANTEITQELPKTSKVEKDGNGAASAAPHGDTKPAQSLPEISNNLGGSSGFLIKRR